MQGHAPPQRAPNRVCSCNAHLRAALVDARAYVRHRDDAAAAGAAARSTSVGPVLSKSARVLAACTTTALHERVGTTRTQRTSH